MHVESSPVSGPLLHNRCYSTNSSYDPETDMDGGTAAADTVTCNNKDHLNASHFSAWKLEVLILMLLWQRPANVNIIPSTLPRGHSILKAKRVPFSTG